MSENFKRPKLPQMKNSKNWFFKIYFMNNFSYHMFRYKKQNKKNNQQVSPLHIEVFVARWNVKKNAVPLYLAGHKTL